VPVLSCPFESGLLCCEGQRRSRGDNSEPNDDGPLGVSSTECNGSGNDKPWEGKKEVRTEHYIYIYIHL